MISKTRLSRRSLLAGASVAALPSGLALPAAAQEKVVRYGISMADIPLTSGQPDRGAGAYQFTGYTIYDPLVAWEMDVADRPGKLIPGLASEWTVNDADKTLWSFKLRPGVKFHDGSAFNADAVVWNLEKVFNKDAPQFDQRQASQVRPRLPSIASYKKIDDMTVEIKTKAVDALFPYQMLWFLVASPAQLGEAGQGLEQGGVGAVGHRPVQARPPGAARACRTGEERGLLEPQAQPQDRQAGADLRARGFQPHRGAAVELGRHDRDAAARCGGAAEAVGHAHRAERDAARLELPPLDAAGLAVDRHPAAQGANLAIDRDAIVKLLGGLAKPALGQVDPSSPWFGKPSFVLKYAPDEARKLMSEAGFSKTQPLKTKFVVASGGTGQMLSLPMNEAIQEMFKDIYIDLEFKVVELEALYTAWRAGAKADMNKDVTANNIAYVTSDPVYAITRFFASNQAAPVGVNWSYYSNPAIDALINEVLTTFDAAKQDALLAKVHEKVVDDAVLIWVVHDTNPHALSPKIKSYVQAQHWFQDLTTIGV